MNKLYKRVEVISTFTELQLKVIKRVPPQNIGKWLSTRFQKLGPTYIKIGQFISARNDIFGDEFSNEFTTLRDHTNPMCSKQSAKVLADVKQKVPFIVSIDDTPLASASIWQVHRAKGKNGRELIVKVKRPGIKQEIEHDLEFLQAIAELFKYVNVSNIDNTIVLLDDFKKFLLHEVNFKRERDNIIMFDKLYTDAFSSRFYIPTVYEKYCSDDVLVMEYVQNEGLQNYQGDAEELTCDIMLFFIRQLIQYGVLHGDPHQGNIGMTKDQRVVLYDYGNILEIDREERFIIQEIVYMLVIGNKYGVIPLLEKLGVEVVDKEAVYKYIDTYVEYMKTLDIKVFASLYNDKHNEKLPIRFNGKVMRILRVYGTLEGVCKQLDPSFNYFKLLNINILDLAIDNEFLAYKMMKDVNKLSGLRMTVFKFVEDM